MIRDVPRTIAFFIFATMVIIFGVRHYMTNIVEDEAVSQLNSVLLTSTTESVLDYSRVQPGFVYLNQDGSAMDTETNFEKTVLDRINPGEATGSILRVDYRLHELQSLTDPSLPEAIRSTQYVWDGSEWTLDPSYDQKPINNRYNISAVRLSYRRIGHSRSDAITDPNDDAYWTYRSTSEVNRSDLVQDQMVAE